MNIRRPILYFILLFLSTINSVSAQMDSIQNWIDPIIMQLENVTENSVSESDVADALEALIETDETRFEVNSLTQEEAVGKLQLSEYQYYQLQLYIEKYGKLVSLHELAAVEGFTHADLLRLRNRLYIGNRREKKSRLHHFFRKGASSLLLRYARVLEKRAGFDKSRENRYLGSPPQLAFKYSYRAPNLIMGLSGEKDSGEPFFKGAQKWGFDHYAFYLGIKNISVIKCLLAGDYRLSFGQGLIMGSGLLGGKGSGSAAIRKMPSSIQPAATLNESDALRGAALHIGNARYSAVLFYGFRQFDGRQDSLPDGETVFEGALSTGGLHRTALEAAKKDALLSHTYGASLRMQQRLFRLSLQAVHTLFAQSVAAPKALYRKYNFNGVNHLNVSIDYQVFIRKCILFGEAAVGNHGYPALLQGMSINLSPLVKVSALWRYYHRGYVALHGRAFGENGTNSGETGLYLTANIVLGAKIECQLFSDLYRFTWLRYRTDKPAVGSDFGTRLSFEIHRNCRLTVRYAYKNKAQNGGDNPYWHEIVSFNRHKARMAFVLTPLPDLSLHTEVNFAANHAPPIGYKKFGYLFFQDIALSWPKVHLQLHARVAYFNTDSYEERIYAYEHDLYYAFTIQGYYYQGWRAFLMLRYNCRFFTIWLRLSQTRYLNRETIGSGLDLINRNHKTDVKVQVRFKF